MTELAGPPQHGATWLRRAPLARPVSAARAALGRDDGATRSRAVADSWPHTPRLLPWSIAGFLVMLWLIPIDAITLPDLPLPVEATFDRVAFIFVAGLWLSWILVGRGRENLRAHVTSIDAAMHLLLVVSVLSVVANAHTLLVVDELELSIKKLAILASFVLFYYVVATGLRPSELGAFQALLVVLAALTALGVIYEYRSGANVFYNWSLKLFPGIFSVGAAPSDPEFGRELITGPTGHAIAIATMLAMALPFAFTGYMRSSTTRVRVMHALAITLILAGCIATVRRTGALGPVAALTALTVYRPRQMLRLVPLGILVVAATQVLAPNAPSRVKAQFVNLAADRSVEGRTNDYDPVSPDVRHGLVLGRGYGSYDPAQHRFLDNEWLGRLIETGVIGAFVYLLLILAMIRVAHRSARTREPIRRYVGISVIGAVAVYAVTNLVFDALAFSQVPYMLFFVGALATVALARESTPFKPETSPMDRQQRRPIARTAPSRLGPIPARPDVSVIIVTHNGKEKALATLRSAQRAVGAVSAEWFVVDSGSMDGTPDAIEREFADVTLVRERNVGFAAGNNIAFAHTHGRYMLLLNPDVEIASGTLSDLVAALDERPEVGAASVIQCSPAGDLLHSIGRFPSTMRQFGEALALPRVPGMGRLQEMDVRRDRYRVESSVDWVVGAFLIVRADALDGVGGLDERFFLYSEEKDWCYRFRQAGWEVRHLPVMTIVHHTGGYDSPGLLAQLTYSKVLFAEKHCGWFRQIGIRAALVLRHALRMAMFRLSSPRRAQRAKHEAEACSVALGVEKPHFRPITDRSAPTRRHEDGASAT